MPACATPSCVTVRALGAVWISNEMPGVLPVDCTAKLVRRGPRGAFLLSIDGAPVAWTDPHGAWIEWIAAEEGQRMKLAGQVALVTGGSRGIGRATALAFAAEGADIAFCHLDDGPRPTQTASEIRALGRRAMHRSLDVVDIAASRAFAQRGAAGARTHRHPVQQRRHEHPQAFEDYTEADYDRILDVHMKGMFFMAQAVYPAMAARGRGCIINVASQRGLKGAVNSAPYCAAKAAIIGFTRALACEAAPKGVRVNAIAPGPIVTDLTATMAPADRQAFIDALPVRRFGRPEEIAATALLLAGPDGGFYVGATLSPNGGDVDALTSCRSRRTARGFGVLSHRRLMQPLQETVSRIP